MEFVLSVDFVIDGKLMTAGSAPPELRPQLARIEDDFRARLRGLVDPVTHRPPRIRMSGDKTLRNMKFTIEGCEQTIDEAQRLLAKPPG